MAIAPTARKALRRLLIPKQAINAGQALLEGNDRHHLIDVLRLEVGAELELSDGEGGLYTGTIANVDKRRVTLSLGPLLELPPPRRPHLTLLHGIARGGRTEYVLQKSTELGVDRLCPVICRRSVSRPKEIEGKHQRYTEVVRQAARQSQRSWLPRLDLAAPLQEALPRFGASAALRLVATFGGSDLSQLEGRIASEAGEIVLLVGPEGGLCAEEIGLAQHFGFEPVSLGPHTLRTETAATALLAVVAFVAGRLDAGVDEQ